MILGWTLEIRAAGEWEWTAGQGWVMGAGAARPTAKEQLTYAYELEQRGEFMDSARQYFLLVQHFPNSQEAGVGLQRLARCLFEMENYYTSFKAIEQVLETYPNTGRKDDLLAIELSIAKKMMVSQTPDLLSREEKDARGANIRRALEIVDAIIEHDPYGPSAAETYLVKGEGNLFIGEINAARTAFETVLEEFSRSDFVERARLGVLRCDSLIGEAKPAELAEQIQVVREAEAERQGGGGEDFSDVDESIRQLAEVEAAKMMEQAAQYRRMGTRAAVKSSEFLYKEVVRRYPGTPQAKEAMALAGDMAIPPEEGRILRNIRGIKLNPFSWNKDPEPPWIVPQINPEDMVMVDDGLGPIVGVPETGLPGQTSTSAGLRPANLGEAGPPAGEYPPAAAFPDAPGSRPAPNFIDGFGSASRPAPAGPVYGTGPAGTRYSPRLAVNNPLPTTSESDLVSLAGPADPPFPAAAPAPIPELSPSRTAPEGRPILNAIDFNAPLTDLIGPTRRPSAPPPAPLPEYGSLDYSAPAYGLSPGQAPVYQPGQPYYASPEPASPYAGPNVYQPRTYEITAGAPVAAPYYTPPASGSGWTLGDDFR
ncbi:MAG: tetratricopeptide repeat protein [Planctomycetota bacterium]|jgi:tetratricopeptide (TPR) repeat protein|nr:tetratricopeptide repeat protein [Planctomycetota bacterium]